MWVRMLHKLLWVPWTSARPLSRMVTHFGREMWLSDWWAVQIERSDWFVRLRGLADVQGTHSIPQTPTRLAECRKENPSQSEFTKLATFSDFPHTMFLRPKNHAQNIFERDLNLLNWWSGKWKWSAHESRKNRLIENILYLVGGVGQPDPGKDKCEC